MSSSFARAYHSKVPSSAASDRAPAAVADGNRAADNPRRPGFPAARNLVCDVGKEAGGWAGYRVQRTRMEVKGSIVELVAPTLWVR